MLRATKNSRSRVYVQWRCLSMKVMGTMALPRIMNATIESILLGQADAATALKEANVKVNEVAQH